MNRRCFLKSLLVSGVASQIAHRQLWARDQKDQKPNVILILIDDMGWRDTGFAGNRFIQTPNIDKLAGRGTIFSQAYAAAPNCAPTRACLLTGQYPPRHGVYTVVDERHAPGSPHHKILAATSKAELKTESITIAEVLKSAGYKTGMVGMWNLGRGRRGPYVPTSQGFDSFSEPKDLGFERNAWFNEKGEYLTDKMTAAGINFIRRSTKSPFFLYLAYHAIHEPFDPKPKLLAACKTRAGASDNDPAYAATVEALDQNIGRLLASLEKLGLDRSTHIIFTSDNGATRQYTAPLRGGKGTLYEGGLRVPAFITGPVVRANQKSQEPISSIDFFPTILNLTHTTPPRGLQLDGVSLAGLLSGKEKSLARRTLFWHFPCYIGPATPASAIRVGSYKLIEFFETGQVELYNLADDPGETKNLAKSDPARTRELLARLRKIQAETKAPIPGKPNPNYDPNASRPRGQNRRNKGSRQHRDKRSKRGTKQ